MKTALLLEKLEGQLATLRQRCAPVAQFATLSARFDRHLSDPCDNTTGLSR